MCSSSRKPSGSSAEPCPPAVGVSFPPQLLLPLSWVWYLEVAPMAINRCVGGSAWAEVGTGHPSAWLSRATWLVPALDRPWPCAWAPVIMKGPAAGSSILAAAGSCRRLPWAQCPTQTKGEAELHTPSMGHCETRCQGEAGHRVELWGMASWSQGRMWAGPVGTMWEGRGDFTE